MTPVLPALRGEAAGTVPAGVVPPAPAGTTWAAVAEIAGFAQAIGAPLRTDLRGGKRGDGRERQRLPQGLVVTGPV